MPELPEVETVRRGLAGWIVGRRFAAVDVRHPRAVRRHLPGPAHFAATLVGCQILDVRRRGKYLWLPLDSGDAVVGHLGMSGQLLLQPAAAPDEVHLRVRFEFADGDPELRFVDQRTFGGLAVSAGGADLPAEIAHIARDPLDPDFSDAAFVAALRQRRTEIKRALLDQSLISGIGNIYADEALWRTRLHGTRPTDRLPPATVTRLLGHVRDVLTEAIVQGGTSFDALYVDVNGRSGYFDRALNVYGQQDRPCRRCGALIRREAFMNRSSFSCPRCQPRPWTRPAAAAGQARQATAPNI
ncbi:bifunctional DNA-formamidopyrimidine glycosylase/DNA-(apurinic or apyrimidinic site) lyase [Solwaraspora sp. WMMD791]|uniref:bifunctional DNA-formamidopyrimidine glycosylase/DNA-(apurinic or apyrimidinic site) lyase n=1 Tax=Solwaraspora sp. WMMD791 TaxID=3016086 RepID=UPI00249B290A|nr:bifunctional DNA-formamidopyrimidine glycosylase/DNA-(apurinic or apyrimidinic site) lyase [Solwaraspora sp. WMMD791]WFE27311.1 bifunctional DNA-formamidopyrimidine glycosylase/DNA-(apurinic or apyrimidinic site) lyase [Solwaraspora sp. WMMD791]